MSISVFDALNHCLFVSREGLVPRKTVLPPEWNSAVAVNDGELSSCIDRVRAQGQRLIVIVSEDDLEATTILIKQRASLDNGLRVGLVVLCRDVSVFLRSRRVPQDLLDLVAEKDFRKGPENHLIRALLQMIRGEEKANSKVSQKTLEYLNQIFIALSGERNPQRLLSTVVTKAIELAGAEGGTLYMVQETDGDMYFRMKVVGDLGKEVVLQNISSKVAENSVSGFVTLTGKILNIPDVAGLRPLTLPQFHKSVDHNEGDRTRSVVTVPLKNSRNEIIAVLQLVNKKNDSEKNGNEGNAFDTDDESLLTSFATQASICMETVDLYTDIQKLFDGFVKASITAIESRDPSTGGHSERVAKMSVALARATTECNVGIYRSVKFREEEIRELEYAALLHDFGKIGVREEVLVKAKKLYPYQLDSIKDRIKICKAAVKIAHLERQVKSGASESGWDRDYQMRLQEIDSYWDMILQINEPTVLRKESIETLERIRNEQLLLPDGSHVSVLTEDEYRALSVTQGSLTESERLEIESHVRHTYQFLKMIPWTKDFRHLTEIAYCHHEKLDGSGYPRGLSSHEIPLQSKIMTISDIFDALTAADRWYKEAVPTEKALDILHYEVGQGKIDPVLFDLFVERKIYDLTQPRDIDKVA